MGTFEEVELAPPDAIFGLSVAFREDPRPEKVNLGVGVFRNAELQANVLSTVHEAEQLMLERNEAKTYLPIDGDAEYVQQIGKLIFGEMSDRICGAQTVGGTGALRLTGDFLHQVLEFRAIHLPDPTWANHGGIFQASGLERHTYPYFDLDTRGLAFEKLVDEMEKMADGSAILFHACCHNPTGIDPTLEQWKTIAEIVTRRHLLTIFDCAYQGFGEGLDADVAGLRHFVAEGIECFVCFSCSKNFGLYAERTGCLFVVCEAADDATRVGSQLRKLIRKNYSNPPCHGARIVRTILGSDPLRAKWEAEVNGMRKRLQEMRHALVTGLVAKGSDCQFLDKQKGLFSFYGLTREQAERLTDEFGIHVPKNGRINVSGLNSKNLDYVVDALRAV